MRDHLANERTFLAWTRTAITIIALGFVIAKFGILLREVGTAHVHPLTARAGAVVGVILVLSGIAVVVVAMMRFLETKRGIDNELLNISASLDIALASLLGVIGIVLTIYLIATA